MCVEFGNRQNRLRCVTINARKHTRRAQPLFAKLKFVPQSPHSWDLVCDLVWDLVCDFHFFAKKRSESPYHEKDLKGIRFTVNDLAKETLKSRDTGILR